MPPAVILLISSLLSGSVNKGGSWVAWSQIARSPQFFRRGRRAAKNSHESLTFCYSATLRRSNVPSRCLTIRQEISPDLIAIRPCLGELEQLDFNISSLHHL